MYLIQHRKFVGKLVARKSTAAFLQQLLYLTLVNDEEDNLLRWKMKSE